MPRSPYNEPRLGWTTSGSQDSDNASPSCRDVLILMITAKQDGVDD
jgi:hypothetical protein